MLLRTLHAVLQSDGCDVAVPAFQRQTAASCDQDTCEHAIARLLLLRTCCEAATSVATQRALQGVDVNRWAVGLLQEGLQHRHVSVRRVACHCAAGVLSAVHLTWGERVLFCLWGWLVLRLWLCLCAHVCTYASSVALCVRACVYVCVQTHAHVCTGREPDVSEAAAAAFGGGGRRRSGAARGATGVRFSIRVRVRRWVGAWVGGGWIRCRVGAERHVCSF